MPSAPLRVELAMPKSSLHSVIQHRFIQRLVAMLISLVIVMIVGTATYHNAKGYFHALEAGEISTANLARAAAQHADDAIKELDAFSGGMVERLEFEGLQRVDKARLRKVFRAQSEVMKQIHGIFVYDADGNWTLTDKDQYPVHANNSDREYFAWHRAHPGDVSMHLGPAVRSRTTGDWVIPLSRRLNNPDGSFAGIFLVTVFVEYFNNFYAGFHLDEDGIFVVALRDGTVLTRRPYKEGVIGASLANGEVFTRFLPYASVGTVRAVSIIDRVERIYSYRESERYPLVVQAGLSLDAVLKPWRQSLYRSVTFVGCLMSIILVLSYALLRQLRSGVLIEQELRDTQVILERLAIEDGLTRLANRRHLDTVLTAEVGRARRLAQPIALLMADVDHFKKYNDCYGHQAGDDCLKSVAQAIKLCLQREGDVAFRYGGEEFVVVLPNTNLSGALTLAENIRAAVLQQGIVHGASDHQWVTLSIGVTAQVPDSGEAGTLLLRSADQALYEAKHRGRNQACASAASESISLRPA